MRFKIIILIALAISTAFTVMAQKLTTSGKEFYVSFPGTINSSSSDYQSFLFLTSAVTTSGTIRNPNTGFNIPFTITAGNVTQVKIPELEATNILEISEIISNKGLIVTAQDTISLYAFSGVPASSDASTVIQVNALGIDYMVTSYPSVMPSYFVIIATEDNTKISITPSANTLDGPSGNTGHQAGETFTVTLNKAQTFYVNSFEDLSGSRISVLESCKPIAVFSGVEAAKVPFNEEGDADCFYEQLFPINAWGKEFIIFSLKDRNTNFGRVYAAQDNTSVMIDGITVAVINAGKSFDFGSITNQARYIKTDKPVQVVEFAASQRFDNDNGPWHDAGPTMITIAPVEQQLKSSVFLSPQHGLIVDHKVSIICKTAETGGTFLDAANIGNFFTPIPGNPLYSQAAVNVSVGQHKLSNDKGFAAYAYGSGSVQGYGYYIGASVEKIQIFFTIGTVSSIGNPTVEVCKGNAVFNIVTATENAAYTWDFGDGSAPVSTQGSVLQQSHHYNTPGTFIVTLTSTSASVNACKAAVSQLTLHVSQALAVSVAISANPGDKVCEGTEVSFTAVPGPGAVNPSFQWKVNAVNSGNNNNIFTYVPANGDMVSCDMGVTNNVCGNANTAISNVIKMTVQKKDLPVSASITVSQNPVCINTNALFTATATNGGSSPSFQWRVNGIDVAGSNGAIFSINNLADGDAVTCVITSSLTGCIGTPVSVSNSIRVGVISMKTVSVSIITAKTDICEKEQVVFTATSTNGGTNPTFQWKFNDVDVGTNANTFSANDLSVGDIIFCVMTGNEKCAALGSVTSNKIRITSVTGSNNATISITASKNPICSGESVRSTATENNTGSFPSFQWQLNGIKVGDSGPGFTGTNLRDGDIVHCILTTRNKCSMEARSNDIVMKILPLPAVAFTPAVVTLTLGASHKMKPVINGKNSIV